MRILFFLVCLCALLTGQAASYDSAVYRSAYSAQLRRSDNGPGLHSSSFEATASGIGSLAGNFDFIDDDAEDEDLHEVPERSIGADGPYLSAGSYLSYASLLKHPFNCYKDTLSLPRQQSGRYILLQVFRI